MSISLISATAMFEDTPAGVSTGKDGVDLLTRRGSDGDGRLAGEDDPDVAHYQDIFSASPYARYANVSVAAVSVARDYSLNPHARFDMSGSSFDDLLIGGTEDDTINGLGGADTIDGAGGNDIINGGDGADILSGGYGADIIRGGEGADLCNGDFGNDEISGGAGQDVLRGNEGNDTLRGDNGADRIFGNEGDDDLYGGGGVDEFVLRITFNNDTIWDFQIDLGDKIDVSDISSVTNMSEFRDHIVDSHTIRFGYASFTLENGVDANDLTWRNVIFG